MTRKPGRALISFFSLALWAALSGGALGGELDRCGDYLVQGELRDTGRSYELVVSRRNDSEHRIRLRLLVPETQAALYLDKRIQAEIRVDKPDQGFLLGATLARLVRVLPGPQEQRREVTLLRDQPCAGASPSVNR